MRLLAPAALLVCVSIAHADVPPPTPRVAWSFVLATDDRAHVFVAYPVNRSHGRPLVDYERVTPGEVFDPGRSRPRIYAFERSALGRVHSQPCSYEAGGPGLDLDGDEAPSPSPTEEVPGLRGAPRGFGVVGLCPPDPLAEFFAQAAVPSTDLPEVVFPAGATVVTTTLHAHLDGGTLTLTVDESPGESSTTTPVAPASAASPPPTSALPTEPVATSAPAPSAPASPPSTSSGCGCHAGRGGSPAMLVVLALAIFTRRRRSPTAA